jgi:hypothetical protein
MVQAAMRARNLMRRGANTKRMLSIQAIKALCGWQLRA